jgi:FkbM family methyltransferase
MNKRKTIAVRIKKEYLYIRTSSPDLGVALASLGGEFESISKAYPKSQKGLIIDAGGYIGTAAIALAKMYPEATVVTIEPSSENFEILKKNIVNYKDIHVENAALVPHATGSVQLHNRGTGDWGFTVVEAPQDADPQFIQNVETITIENILFKYGYDDVMVLKMDIEGGEYQLFHEMSWLRSTSVLLVELHERIVRGCEIAFFHANTGRYVYRDRGEKYISIGENYFQMNRGISKAH